MVFKREAAFSGSRPFKQRTATPRQEKQNYNNNKKHDTRGGKVMIRSELNGTLSHSLQSPFLFANRMGLCPILLRVPFYSRIECGRVPFYSTNSMGLYSPHSIPVLSPIPFLCRVPFYSFLEWNGTLPHSIREENRTLYTMIEWDSLQE